MSTRHDIHEATHECGANIFSRILVIALVGGIASCANTSQWSEFHGQRSNAGYIGINTSDPGAISWLRAGVREIGDVAFSSPAVSEDTVYIADLNGYLWGVSRSTTASDRLASAPNCTMSSPAIGSEGFIHVTALCVRGASTISQICRVAPKPKLTLVDCVDFPPGYTTSAPPKLWAFGGQTFAFIPAYFDSSRPNKRKLLVYSAGELLAQQDIECPTTYDTIEGGDDDAWKWGLAFLTGGWSLTWDQTRPGFKVPGIDLTAPALQPTIGIHDRGESKVTLVAAFHGCRVRGFEWNPQSASLTELWTLQRGDAGNYSSPAISFNGSTWIGTSDGHIYVFHAISGQIGMDFEIEEPIIATPAIAAGNSVYVVSKKHIHLFRSGEKVVSVELPGETAASPAVSLNHVYVAHSVGVSTFDLDLQQGTVFSDPHDRFVGWGSSPAIAPNGEVYAATTDGRLYTFRP